MARKRTYDISRAVAMGVGALLVGTDTWLSAGHAWHVDGGLGSLTVAIVVTTLGAACAIPLAERAWAAGRYIKATGLALFFFVMVCFSFSASIDRVATVRDDAIAEREATNAAHALALQALEDARQNLADSQSAAEAECATGIGRNCRTQRAEVNAARSRVDLAMAQLARAGAPKVEDPMASRLSAVLPFLTAEQIQIFQPLLLPFGLQIGGFLFIALGLQPNKVVPPVSKPRKKAKARTKTTPRKDTPLNTPAPYLRLVAAND